MVAQNKQPAMQRVATRASTGSGELVNGVASQQSPATSRVGALVTGAILVFLYASKQRLPKHRSAVAADYTAHTAVLCRRSAALKAHSALWSLDAAAYAAAVATAYKPPLRKNCLRDAQSTPPRYRALR